MKTTAFFSGLITIGLLLVVPHGALPQIYKWTDANGVTHYSEDPPPQAVTDLSSMASAAPASAAPAKAAALSEALRRQLGAIRVPADPLP